MLSKNQGRSKTLEYLHQTERQRMSCNRLKSLIFNPLTVSKDSMLRHFQKILVFT
jgi:hypothetical protein